MGRHHNHHKANLAEIGRFWGLGRPPQDKIALSRRDRTISGFGQATTGKIALCRRDRTILGLATTRQNRLISLGFGQATTGKIALSRRDRTILGLGQATTRQNRLISPRWDDVGVWAVHHKAKSPYLAEIRRFWGLGRPPQGKIALSRRDRTILGFGQATTRQNRLVSPR